MSTPESPDLAWRLERLAQLEQLLLQQVELAGRENLDPLDDSLRDSRQIALELEKLVHPPHEQTREALCRVADLYQRLCLTLAQRREEVMRQLQANLRSRGMLNAYRQGTSRP